MSAQREQSDITHILHLGRSAGATPEVQQMTLALSHMLKTGSGLV
jgi:hypothetical protein